MHYHCGLGYRSLLDPERGQKRKVDPGVLLGGGGGLLQAVSYKVPE